MTTVNLSEMINGAIKADALNVPVDWMKVALTIYNTATAHIEMLEAAEKNRVAQVKEDFDNMQLMPADSHDDEAG